MFEKTFHIHYFLRQGFSHNSLLKEVHLDEVGIDICIDVRYSTYRNKKFLLINYQVHFVFSSGRPFSIKFEALSLAYCHRKLTRGTNK